ncbi:MAG: chromate transporter [Christensenellales bacterium]
MIYLRLFIEFFQIGLFAIGGGLATLPFLERLSQSTGWFSLADLTNMIAISESTPGPIGINMATYVGHTTAGILGATVATLAEVLPSIILVLIIARFLRRFSENRIVLAVFYGLRAASVGLIAAAGFSVLKVSLLNVALWETSGKILDLVQWKGILLAGILWFVIKKWKPHPIVTIGASAVVGIVFRFAGM